MPTTDEQLIQASLSGDQDAFAEIVRRYQVLICSVALSIVRDVSLSEDIGQEAFLIAWKKLASLNDPSRLKPWLTQIARNCARSSLRGKSVAEASLETAEDLSRPTTTPEQTAMNREEQQLVSQTLDQLPELFREPLILFYRQDQSVAQVADSLELTPSAVKQRLARGRELLRDEVMATIERSLRKTVPAAAFTVAVVNALPALTKTAAAATVVGTAATAGGAAASSAGKLSGAAGAVSGVAKTTAATGTAGAVGGSLLGFGGAFFGFAAAWLTARYKSQRKIYVHYFIFVVIASLIFSIPFIAMKFGWKPWETFGGHGRMVVAQLSWMALFFIVLGGSSVVMQLALKSVSKKAELENEPELPQTSFSHWLDRWEGRRFTSKMRLLGLPLVDVAFSDPASHYDTTKEKLLVAHGWIAMGDNARGRLLAFGGRTAIAPIAFGTLAVGVISFGVLSVGLLSLSVVGIGMVSVGVAALGIWSGGVIALGWATESVISLGVSSAIGVIAYSLHDAVGVLTNGEPFNTPAADALLSESRLHTVTMWVAGWYQSHKILRFLTMPLLFLVSVFPLLIGYRRKRMETA